MKKIKVYEFKELARDVQRELRGEAVGSEVMFQLEMLNDDTSLSEREYWDAIGCTHSYGESTPWFVPAVYYEHNKELVDTNVQKELENTLYTFGGVPVGVMSEAV